MANNSGLFSRLAKAVSRFTGSALCFGLALISVLVWALTGPIFHYSARWQMAIDAGTSIITFLMVFLIQRSQNLDTEAIHIKLNELIRATQGAQNALLDLEEHEPNELAKFRSHYKNLASKPGSGRLHRPVACIRRTRRHTSIAKQFDSAINRRRNAPEHDVRDPGRQPGLRIADALAQRTRERESC